MHIDQNDTNNQNNNQEHAKHKQHQILSTDRPRSRTQPLHVDEWEDHRHNNNQNTKLQQQQHKETEEIFYARLEAARKAL